MNLLKKLLAAALMLPALAIASSAVHLDKAPLSTAPANLQNGAKLFINNCLNCHGASYMRYNRLTDIGLTEEQIRNEYMTTAEKIGEPMQIALRRNDGKTYFGAPPPDLTVIARSRASEFGSGADWLYTYLRQFYRDPNRPTGWNNVVFENVGMPHVLWELQGEQHAKVSEVDDGHGGKKKQIDLELAKPGKMTKAEYDQAVADLVSYIVWMGEPVAEKRKTIGAFVLAGLAVLFGLAFALKKAYWKDIH